MEGKILYEINAKSDGGWEICRPLSWRLEDFRRDRLNKIEQGEALVKLEDGPKVVLHLIPQGTLEAAVDLDLKQFANSPTELFPLGSGGFNHRFNALGLLTESSSRKDGYSSAYLQLFRDGIVETVSSGFFTSNNSGISLASLFFEQEVLKAITRYVSIAKKLNISGPHWAAISLLGVKGCLMAIDPSRHWFSTGSPIADDRLLIPYARIENEEISKTMRPIFDFVWQAAGWPGSHNYDAEGNRTS